MSIPVGYRDSVSSTKNSSKNIYRSEISQAWCPAHVECCVSVGRRAQFRRSLALKCHEIRAAILGTGRSFWSLFMLFEQHEIEQAASIGALSHISSSVPVTPQVRILETIDLSTSDIEHFLMDDAPVPVTPPLAALAPVQEMQSLPRDTMSA